MCFSLACLQNHMGLDKLRLNTKKLLSANNILVNSQTKGNFEKKIIVE
jgi:hypothetical protein